tara:strand:+ start:2143 stop:2919 length:777 start_codon:yes stop_codon:yes gene_type:complete
MINVNPSKILEKIIPITITAGNEILEIYKNNIVVSYKDDGSPVTNADKNAEKIILNELKNLFPDIEIVSEENLESHNLQPSKTFFLVDPIDGTKEFLRQDGKGAFTVNIALIHEGQPILGIVNAPALGRLFYGSIQEGAKEVSNEKLKKIFVRDIPDDGALALASRSHNDQKTTDWLTKNNVSKTMSTGSSVKFCLIAAGEADVYPRFGPTMEWDTAAGDAVLRAAGGRVVGLDGKDFNYGKNKYKNDSFIALGKFKL